MSKIARAFPLAAALLLCANACCLLPRGRGPVPPPITRGEVIEALDRQAQALSSLTDAHIALRTEVTTPEERKKWPKLGGVLAFDSRLPGLWLRGEKLAQKVFDLRATGESFWLAAPREKTVYIGSGAAYDRFPAMVRPAEVLQWFGPPDAMDLNAPTTTMAVEEEDYRFDVMGGQILRLTVYVDRRRVAVSRIVEWDPDIPGVVRTDVLLAKHKIVSHDDASYDLPRRITIHRPQDGYRVRLNMGRPRLNKELKPELFAPRSVPPGWTVVDLDKESRGG